jgi:hypothetical protein
MSHPVRDRRVYDNCTLERRSIRESRRANTQRHCFAHSRSCLLRAMVLAFAGMAWLPGGNSRGRAVALARGNSFRARLRRGAQVCLGLRLDGSGNSRPHRSPATIGRSGLLSLRAQSDVCRLCRGMDWAMDRLRASRPKVDSGSSGSCVRRALVCRLL